MVPKSKINQKRLLFVKKELASSGTYKPKTWLVWKHWVSGTLIKAFSSTMQKHKGSKNEAILYILDRMSYTNS